MSLTSISARLTSAQSALLERSRVISLGMTPSASSTHSLVRTLKNVKGDLDEAPESEEGDELRELETRYDRIIDMLAADDEGRERAKDLRRERRREPTPPPVASPQYGNSRSPSPTPKPIKPFRDEPSDDEDEPEQSHHEILQQQQDMMEDQDERLNLLSHSINRQNHLSLQIGDELDVQAELLESTDAAMDNTANRLNRARRRLDHVADNAKQHGSTITIVALIFILLLLIIIFKT